MKTHRWGWMLWTLACALVLCSVPAGAATLAAWVFGGGGGMSGGGGLLAGSTLGERGFAGPAGGGASRVTAGFQAAWLATLGAEVDLGPDTDGDGIPDSIDPDDDNDGLSDTEEDGLGTNRLLVDTDGDGFDDFVEARVTHTGAVDRDSFLRCVDVRRAGGFLRVDWTSSTLVTNYFIDRALKLSDPAPWSPWQGPLPGTGTVTSVSDPAPPVGASYRVRIPY